jgi:methylated-DNA-[protein]-cysteine S-methyltransferase
MASRGHPCARRVHPMSPAVLTFTVDRLPSPLGRILLVSDSEQRLRALNWEDHEDRLERDLRRIYGRRSVQLEPGAAPPAIRRALERYFGGKLQAIDEIAVATGGTPFQSHVWRGLRRKCPLAVRAVGLANGSNPISIVIPCHRLIGADGSLTGYGGGLERKRWLLEHEGVRFGE